MHSPEIIRQYFSYNPATGIITRIAGSVRSNGVPTSKGVGQPAGTSDGHGYLSITLFHNGVRQKMLAHRVAWVLFYGEWPNGILDHINRVKIDNRIQNLRIATASENRINSERCEHKMVNIRQVTIPGKSGVWWKVQVQRNGQRKYTHRRHLADAMAFRDAFTNFPGHL